MRHGSTSGSLVAGPLGIIRSPWSCLRLSLSKPGSLEKVSVMLGDPGAPGPGCLPGSAGWFCAFFQPLGRWSGDDQGCTHLGVHVGCTWHQCGITVPWAFVSPVYDEGLNGLQNQGPTGHGLVHTQGFLWVTSCHRVPGVREPGARPTLLLSRLSVNRKLGAVEALFGRLALGVCVICPVSGGHPGFPGLGLDPLFRALPIVGLVQMRAPSEK